MAGVDLEQIQKAIERGHVRYARMRYDTPTPEGWIEVDGYPPPQEHPFCICYPNMMRAHFCMQGHMTECHVGMNCSEAECSHYQTDVLLESDFAAGEDL